MEKRRMFTTDWIDYNLELIDEYVQEAYWNDHFDAELVASDLISLAIEKGVHLVDAEDYDLVGELQNIYDVSEKGLS